MAALVVDEPAKTKAANLAPVETTKPAALANKRNPFFASFSKLGSKKSISEAKPLEAAPIKDKDADTVEPVSAEALVIPALEATEPLAAAIASPATVLVAAVTNGVTKTAEAKLEVKLETKTESTQKRKSIFGLGTSKDKKEEGDGEKLKTYFAKIRNTIKGKSSPKTAEKAPEKASEKTEETAAETAAKATAETAAEPTAETLAATDAIEATAEPIISEPISAAPAAAPQVSATA